MNFFFNNMYNAKAMGLFRDSQAPSWLSGTRADVPAEPPSFSPFAYVRLHMTHNGVSPTPRHISKGKQLRYLILFRYMFTYFDGIRYLYFIL